MRRSTRPWKLRLTLLLLLLILAGCATWKLEVDRPPIDQYYATFERSHTLPATSAADALGYAKSAVESMGFQVQSVTEALGMLRTEPLSTITDGLCDCGTWNRMEVADYAAGTLLVTLGQSGGDAQVSVDFECDLSFNGTDFYGALIRQDYRCASRGVKEAEFFGMLNRIAAAHASSPRNP